MLATLLLGLLVSHAAQDGATVELPPDAYEVPAEEPVAAPEAAPEAEAETPAPEVPVAGKKKIAPRKSGSIRPKLGGDADLPNLGSMVFWTLFVLALLGGVFFVLRRFTGRGRLMGSDAIRVLARRSISARQQVVLLEVGPKVFLVGATKEQLCMLGEIGTPDEVASVKSLSPVYSKDSVEGAFRQTLQEGLKKGEAGSPAKESCENVMDELKQIRKTVLSWRA
jgi:flagellar biosynthetic protein FliO